jgi:hypothetical protein
MTKLAPDLTVRRSTAAIVFLEALLAVVFVLGVTTVFRQPSLLWTLIIPSGIMIAVFVHHSSFVLRIDDGVLMYREPFRGITRIPLVDIEKTYIEGWFGYRGKGKLPKRLIILPKPSSSIHEFGINLAIFERSDIGRLLERLAVQGGGQS